MRNVSKSLAIVLPSELQSKFKPFRFEYLTQLGLKSNFLKWMIRIQFPTVRSISTSELDRWLNTPQSVRPLMLDARTEAEFAVSHLATAQRIDPNTPDWSQLATVPKETPIVVYCSVGYRSARIAEQLQQQGFVQVLNLEGSIFQWANEARSLYQNDRPTDLVHPYNDRWGKLLKPQYRAPLL